MEAVLRTLLLDFTYILQMTMVLTHLCCVAAFQL